MDKSNHINFKPYIEILNKIKNAINEKPINNIEIQKIVFKLSQNFKYPNIEKCCKTCDADITNNRWKRGLDMLKNLEGKTNEEELKENPNTIQVLEQQLFFYRPFYMVDHDSGEKTRL